MVIARCGESLAEVVLLKSPDGIYVEERFMLFDFTTGLRVVTGSGDGGRSSAVPIDDN